MDEIRVSYPGKIVDIVCFKGPCQACMFCVINWLIAVTMPNL